MEETDKDVLEARKVKALEKIASSLDALTLWFEEVNKEDWDARLQFYLGEFHKLAGGPTKKDEEKGS